MDNVLYSHNTKTQDVVDTLFGSEKINEGVSLLGKGVGVAVVSKGLGLLIKKMVLLEWNR